MILFFFGEDAFRMKEKRLALKNTFFVKNPGSTGFFEFDFSDGAEMKEVSSCLSQTGLFVVKKFVIVGNIFDAPLETRRALADFLDTNKESLASDENRILLLFQTGQPKKNEKLWKVLANKEVRAQEFALLGEPAILRWIGETAKRCGALGVDSKAQKLLLDICRNDPKQSGKKPSIDMFRLDAETRKLAAYRRNEMIREEDVAAISPPVSGSESIFQALDALFSGRKKEAAAMFSALMRDGDALGLLAMCAWQLRNIIRTKGAIADGQVRNPFDAAKLLGMHPFAAGKCFALASQTSIGSLESAFSLLARLDREAKSGGRDPESALLDFVMAS